MGEFAILRFMRTGSSGEFKTEFSFPFTVSFPEFLLSMSKITFVVSFALPSQELLANPGLVALLPHSQVLFV